MNTALKPQKAGRHLDKDPTKEFDAIHQHLPLVTTVVVALSMKRILSPTISSVSLADGHPTGQIDLSHKVRAIAEESECGTGKQVRANLSRSREQTKVRVVRSDQR